MLLDDGLLNEIESQKWAMLPSAFNAFVGEIQTRMSKSVTGIFEKSEPAKMSVKGGVATIPIRGTLMNKVPALVRFLGIEATEYSDIIEQTHQAVKNKSVYEISYAIDSPGGSVVGSLEAANAIFDAKQAKATRAVVGGMGASAAYLLASQTEKIYADSPNSMLGSIGIFAPLVDTSKMAEMNGIEVHMIRSGELKGTGFPGAKISDKQIEAEQEIVNALADNMIKAIARGRGTTEGKIKELATGKTWLSEQSITLGLADEVRPNNEIPTSERAKAMDEKEVQAKVDAACAEATSKALTTEDIRVAEISKAFPDDPAFALKQIQAKSSVLESKAAYADVLSERLKKAKAESEKLAEDAKKAEGVPGANPVPFGESSENPKSFAQLVTECMAEKKCSVAQAQRIVNAENPGLYEKSRGQKK